jgi:DNA invertase Pin-like site-specific DNA recombinase
MRTPPQVAPLCTAAPAIMRFLAEAARGSFDLMLAESMSRVGRDQEDRAAIRNRLGFHGIAIATPTDGVVTPLVDGIRAVIDSQQLEDLKHHTPRHARAACIPGLLHAQPPPIVLPCRGTTGRPSLRAVSYRPRISAVRSTASSSGAVI